MGNCHRTRGSSRCDCHAKPATRGGSIMKTWFGYGSVHSMNLVMIGHFNDAGSAERARQALESIATGVTAEVDAGRLAVGGMTDRFSDPIWSVLTKVSISTLTPSELEQFAFESDISVDGSNVIVTTEEIEVSAFLMVMLEKG